MQNSEQYGKHQIEDGAGYLKEIVAVPLIERKMSTYPECLANTGQLSSICHQDDYR